MLSALTIFLAAMPRSSSANESGILPCTRAFRAGAVCELSIDTVLDIETGGASSASDCQDSCFRDAECAYFTFYMRSGERKCVLFSECGEMSRCRSCFTGPALPSIAECMAEEALGDRRETTTAANEDETRTTTNAQQPRRVHAV